MKWEGFAKKISYGNLFHNPNRIAIYLQLSLSAYWKQQPSQKC